jgi:nicotinamidase-related amidase
MTAAYLVLDLINDIVDPKGPSRDGFAAEAARRDVLNNTAAALVRARAAKVRIIYVRVGFSPGYPECPTVPWSRFFKARQNGLFRLGEWGTEIHAAVAPHEEDPVVLKHRVSPFHATTLDPILRANGIDTLFVSGISSNAVVQAAVREGHDRDYRMVVLEDCCSALNADEHESAIRLLNGFATIASSKAVDFG